ncbi:MAG: CRISPR-associated protein Cas4 [Chloroflexota bacterium]
MKQFVYCPRVVYFSYCVPLKRPTTYKMEEGRLEHGRTEELEHRRTLSSYGLRQGVRHFGVYLVSQRWGLSGLLDMVVETEHEVIPVEYKNSTGKIGLNHKYQLAAYALLTEERWGKPVRRGFVYFIPAKKSQEVPITPNMRRFVRNTLVEIRSMVERELMPMPTRHKERCRDCEFGNFCRDRD